MKHAYLIIAHAEIEVFRALIRLIDDKRNDIFVHVDKKADIDPFRSVDTKYSRMTLLHEIDVIWGHFNLVRVEMLLLRKAREAGDYAYYHLLSGVDLPLKSQDEIHSFFEKNQGKEMVEIWGGQDTETNCVDRMHYFYNVTPALRHPEGKYLYTAWYVLNKRVAQQKMLGIYRNRGIEFKKGGQWFSITHDFVDYILSKKWWVWKSFIWTFCPDEHFIQTLIWNSPFKERIYESPEIVRKIDWQRGNPYTWKNSDYGELKDSAALFARKFSSSEMTIVKKLVENIQNGKNK